MESRHPLRTVTPSLDGEVLAVLAGGDAEFTGREVQRMAGARAHSAVQHVLGRLVEQGVVQRRRAGNAYLYRLNRDHLAAEPIIRLASLRVELIRRLRELAAELAPAPTAMSLFGSVARGDDVATSDLDLLVVRPAGLQADDEHWRRALDVLAGRATAWTGNDARILEYGEEELERLWDEPVLEEAIADGIELRGSLRRMRNRASRDAG